MKRFGGWQARWLASVIMMSAQGSATANGILYIRESKKSHKKITAEIYVIGIVDIDQEWLDSLFPDKKQHEAFVVKGAEDEFYIASTP